MKFVSSALAGALLALVAAVQLQCGPEWKVDAAVEAAIARGDLRQARELAVSAKHWSWIIDAQPVSAYAPDSRPKGLGA